MATQPVSDRENETGRLSRLIRDSYAASRGVYGARRALADLLEAGERYGKLSSFVDTGTKVLRKISIKIMPSHRWPAAQMFFI